MQGRRIVKTRTAKFLTYDMDGPVQHDMAWLPLSYDGSTREGSYIIRMNPGARTIAHTHARQEEYFIIEGSLIEDDGTVLTPGDLVIMAPGTRHSSRTEEGCLLIAIDWKRSPHPGGSPEAPSK
jgi:mannose-6-phosphate isomerase-like protein (cupin superfamily)